MLPIPGCTRVCTVQQAAVAGRGLPLKTDEPCRYALACLGKGKSDRLSVLISRIRSLDLRNRHRRLLPPPLQQGLPQRQQQVRHHRLQEQRQQVQQQPWVMASLMSTPASEATSAFTLASSASTPAAFKTAPTAFSSMSFSAACNNIAAYTYSIFFTSFSTE